MVLAGLRRQFRSVRHEMEFRFFERGRDAIQAAEMAPPDVVVTDSQMPEMSGSVLLSFFRRHFNWTRRVLLTGGVEEGVDSTEPCAERVLFKPQRADEIAATIRELTAQGDRSAGDRPVGD